MGAFSNPLLTGVFGPLLGTTNTTTLPSQSPAIAGEQQGLLSVLNGMLDPATDQTLAPVKAAGESQINTNYAGLPNQVTRQAASRGFGSSGVVGGGLLGVDSSRLSSLAGLSGTMGQLSSERQLSAAQIIQSILQNNTGRSGTYTGGSLAGLSAIQQLLKMIQGGGKAPAGLPSIPGMSLPSYPGTPPTFPTYPGSGSGVAGSGSGSAEDIINQILSQMGQAPLPAGGPGALPGTDPVTGRGSLMTPSDGSYSGYQYDAGTDYAPGWGDNGYGDEE